MQCTAVLVVPGWLRASCPASAAPPANSSLGGWARPAPCLRAQDEVPQLAAQGELAALRQARPGLGCSAVGRAAGGPGIVQGHVCSHHIAPCTGPTSLHPHRPSRDCNRAPPPFWHASFRAPGPAATRRPSSALRPRDPPLRECRRLSVVPTQPQCHNASQCRTAFSCCLGISTDSPQPSTTTCWWHSCTSIGRDSWWDTGLLLSRGSLMYIRVRMGL